MKRSAKDLRNIEHSYPTIGRQERTAVLRVLKSSYLAEGQEVREFEKELSAYIGGTGAVAAGSGTLALHLALTALGVGYNDEVILPSYVCRSVLNAVLYCRAKPVLCDVNGDDYTLSFSEARRKLSKKTKAIIVAHMFGFPVPLERFKKLGVPVIEDCAHAVGAELNGRKAGSRGDLSIFSFEGTKYIVAGEGGMVVANSSRLLKILRALKEPDAFDYKVKLTYRMTDLQAAVGRAQLARLESFIRNRRTIVEKYNAAFASLDMELPKDPAGGRHVFHRYMVNIKHDSRAFREKCLRQGVKVKQPVKPYPLHRYLGLPDKSFPETSAIMRSAVSIPVYPALTARQVRYVIKVVKDTYSGKRKK